MLGWIVAIIVLVIAFVIYKNTKAPDSASYKLMTEVFAEMGVKDARLVTDSIAWNIGRYQTIDGKMMKLYRPGYSFKAIDETDLGSRFATELIASGFTQDLNNSGDATFNSTQGYAKGPIGCTIRLAIVIDDVADYQEGVAYPIDTTISCADNVLWENKTAPASTTDLSTFQG